MLKHGLYFRAIPDSGTVRVALDPTGTPAPIWPNHTSFAENHTKYLLNNSDTFWAGAEKKINVSKIKWIVNSLADVDEYKNSLTMLDELTLHNIPIFNHPRTLINTRRDIVSEKLSTLKSVTVPKCVRIVEKDKDNFKKAVKLAGIKPPLIMRPEKSQTGQGMVVLDNEEELISYIEDLEIKSAYYMTEFIDSVQPDDLYYKARLIFVGPEYFVRHVKSSKNRILHRESSEITFSWEEEKKYMEYLISNTPLNEDLVKIKKSVGLDYFGIDLGIDFKNQKFVFFEANPAMSVFVRNKKNEDLLKIKRRDYLQSPINKKLMELLMKPGEWMFNYQKIGRRFIDIYAGS